MKKLWYKTATHGLGRNFFDEFGRCAVVLEDVKLSSTANIMCYQLQYNYAVLKPSTYSTQFLTFATFFEDFSLADLLDSMSRKLLLSTDVNAAMYRAQLYV